MAFNPITMNQVKQIYKLRAEGYGIKTIAATLGISKNTVKSYLRKTAELELSGDELMATDNPILADQLKPVSAQEKDNYQAFLQRAEHYVKELSRRKQTHVTRMILWEEDFHAGLIQMRYSRFCFHLRRYLKSKQPSMVMVHRPGEKIFVDFAGDKLHYIDPETGKRVAVEVLLITLGYSNYTLAVGLRSQKKEDLIEGLVYLFSWLGAVTAALVPDNLKSAVTTPDRYEAIINETFLDMANHYNIAVVPTRPIKPKDKAKVETHVNVVYQQVYARLRHKTFHSLEEVNQALREKIELLNDAVLLTVLIMDWRRHEIFTVVLLAGALGGLLGGFLLPEIGLGGVAWGALVGGVIMLIMYGLGRVLGRIRYGREGLAWGDVELAVMLGLVTGFPGIVTPLFWGPLVGVALFLRRGLGNYFPFAPGLCLVTMMFLLTHTSREPLWETLRLPLLGNIFAFIGLIIWGVIRAILGIPRGG